MTYVLNSPLGIARAKAERKATPGLFKRLFATMIESRTRAAEREIRARNLLVNEAEITLGGFPAATLSGDTALPFNR